MASFSITNWVSFRSFVYPSPFLLTNKDQDFPPVKFIIDCFQDKYPGLLGHVLFYNAPKIFSGKLTGRLIFHSVQN